MKFRVVVVAIIQNNKGQCLICKKPERVGIFPGQWAIPAGGIDEGERMGEALRREVWEEVGLKINDIQPLYFIDDVQKKYLRDGTVEEHYMIYLYFKCKSTRTEVKLGDEFEEYAWVGKSELKNYDLNEATINTFRKLGWM